MSIEPRPGPHNALIDVPGIRVGHHTVTGNGFLTGTTVVLAPDGGMVAGIDVRGGGPATHETDLLDPSASVERIHAVVLTGGSAFGLAACTGVMNVLADRAIGLTVGPDNGEVVPLVPGAALFDLGRGGDFHARPTADFGSAALAAADSTTAANAGTDLGAAVHPGAAQGGVGAGTGAVTCNLKGGIGTASVVLSGGITVAALAAVNAAGSPIDRRTGELLGARLLLPADGPPPAVPNDAARDALLEVTAPRRPGIAFSAQSPRRAPGDRPAGATMSNTTLVVVATDAALSKAQCTKMAAVAQNGLARALNPVHTMFDGDVVFGLAIGGAGGPGHRGLPEIPVLHEITVAGADVVTRAIVRSLLAAETTTTDAGQWPSWTDVVAGSPRT